MLNSKKTQSSRGAYEYPHGCEHPHEQDSTEAIQIHQTIVTLTIVIKFTIKTMSIMIMVQRSLT